MSVLRWATLMVAILLTGACALLRPPETHVTIPAIPFLDNRILLMDALPDNTDVCTFSHAYTGRELRNCASLGAVRGFINAHLLAAK